MNHFENDLRELKMSTLTYLAQFNRFYKCELEAALPFRPDLKAELDFTIIELENVERHIYYRRTLYAAACISLLPFCAWILLRFF